MAKINVIKPFGLNTGAGIEHFSVGVQEVDDAKLAAYGWYVAHFVKATDDATAEAATETEAKADATDDATAEAGKTKANKTKKA